MNPTLIPRLSCRPKRAASRFSFSFLAGLSLLLFGAAGLSSCATTRGLGQDVQKVGDKIEEAAHR